MIIKASLDGARIAEIPITLHPDGRKRRRRICGPSVTAVHTTLLSRIQSAMGFFAPGFILALIGLAGYSVALPGLKSGA